MTFNVRLATELPDPELRRTLWVSRGYQWMDGWISSYHGDQQSLCIYSRWLLFQK